MGAKRWRDFRKLRVNSPGRAEVRNIRALALWAVEGRADVVAFVRDRDGNDRDDNSVREADVEAGIAEAQSHAPTPKIVGGVAIRKLESWLLALQGVVKSEENRRPEEKLVELCGQPVDTRKMVGVIEASRMDRLPRDAESLKLWLKRASMALR